MLDPIADYWSLLPELLVPDIKQSFFTSCLSGEATPDRDAEFYEILFLL